MLNPILIVLFTSGPMKSWHTEMEDTIARNVILGQIFILFNSFIMIAELILKFLFLLYSLIFEPTCQPSFPVKFNSLHLELLNQAKNISVVLLCFPIKWDKPSKGPFMSYNRTYKQTNCCFYKNLKSRFIPLFDDCFLFKNKRGHI